MSESQVTDDELASAIRLFARMASLLNDACQDAGISLVQYRILVLVSRQPERAMQLAKALRVTRPTLTSNLRTVERRGYISRSSVAEDGRGVQLHITKKGRTVLERAEAEQREKLRTYLRPSDLRRLKTLAVLHETFDRELIETAESGSIVDADHLPPRRRAKTS